MTVRVRVAVAIALVLLTVAGLLVSSRGGPALVKVPQATERWSVGSSPGGWQLIEVPEAASLLLATPEQLVEGVVTRAVHAGDLVPADAVSSHGVTPAQVAGDDEELVRVRVTVDASAWPSGPLAGATAIFASVPGGCARFTLPIQEVVDSGSTVVVAVPPSEAAVMTAASSWWTVAAPAGDAGWPACSEPAAGLTRFRVPIDASVWPGGPKAGVNAVFAATPGGCARFTLRIEEVADEGAAVVVEVGSAVANRLLHPQLVPEGGWVVFEAPAEGRWSDC